MVKIPLKLIRAPAEMRHFTLVAEIQEVLSQLLTEIRILLVKSEFPMLDPWTVKMEDPVFAILVFPQNLTKSVETFEIFFEFVVLDIGTVSDR